MNRTDRLLAIVLELQRHGARRAEDLAATFETSKRTIYRDMDALAESGVPIVSMPGHGYSLVDGYFLPPLSFSHDEAIMLLLGADAMAGTFDAQYRKAADSAGAKIETVLAPKQRGDVKSLKASFMFVSSFLASDPAVLERLQQLRRAILECRVVRFRYHARFAAPESSGAFRLADPHGLAFVERSWYLSARDHKHDDVRRFRLDRIEALSLTDTYYARPDAEALLAERDRNARDELSLEVVALFAPRVARWVREARSWFAVSEEDTRDGLRVTFRVRHADELTQYLLQWGGAVRVESPASLRAQLADEARAMLAAHAA